jgi:hypothetical protein
MLARALSRFAILASALGLVGCLALPSDQQVAQQFRRDYPVYTVQSVSHATTEFSGDMPIEAVFRVVYTKPGDSRSHTFERKFGRVAEGWLESSGATHQ